MPARKSRDFPGFSPDRSRSRRAESPRPARGDSAHGLRVGAVALVRGRALGRFTMSRPDRHSAGRGYDEAIGGMAVDGATVASRFRVRSPATARARGWSDESGAVPGAARGAGRGRGRAVRRGAGDALGDRGLGRAGASIAGRPRRGMLDRGDALGSPSRASAPSRRSRSGPTCSTRPNGTSSTAGSRPDRGRSCAATTGVEGGYFLHDGKFLGTPSRARPQKPRGPDEARADAAGRSEPAAARGRPDRDPGRRRDPQETRSLFVVEERRRRARWPIRTAPVAVDGTAWSGRPGR